MGTFRRTGLFLLVTALIVASWYGFKRSLPEPTRRQLEAKVGAVEATVNRQADAAEAWAFSGDATGHAADRLAEVGRAATAIPGIAAHSLAGSERAAPAVTAADTGAAAIPTTPSSAAPSPDARLQLLAAELERDLLGLRAGTRRPAQPAPVAGSPGGR
ncbi:MAG: hypothetical protein HY719_14225 [Planctomycetes bacterium]|nr:hypothetical protein [Planctomycetota bacterium]